MQKNFIGRIRIGGLYTTTGEDAWLAESGTEQPTVTFLNLRTGERFDGVVRSGPINRFKALVPEEPLEHPA